MFRHSLSLVRCCALVGILPCLTFSATGQVIQQMNLATNSIIFDPFSGYIYASMPSTAGPLANTIVTINPNTAAVHNSVFIGSNPNTLALSHDGQYLYTGLDGAAAVRRLHLPTQTAGLQFSLGVDASHGPYYAEDIAVQPGNADVIAVSRRNQGFSPRHEGVAIYDNGIMRPQTTPDHTGSNRIEFGSSPNTLYGINNETTEFGFRVMNVTASGVSTISTTPNLVPGFSVDMEYEGGLLYATNGRVVNPATQTLAGTFPVTGPVEADAANNRVFYLTGSGTTRIIDVFNMQTFAPVGSIAVTGVSGSASDLVRWGSNGLAFRTSGNQLFLIQSNLVPAPSGLACLAIALTLRRRWR